ncbi:Solitary outer membrane autotransporter beta-barrel domain [Vibrio splendidus]
MKYLLLYLSVFTSMFAQADDTFKKLLDQNFATAVLLSDSDAISLGFHDFNASSVFGDNLGSMEALDNRKQISVYNAPFTRKLDELTLSNGKKINQNVSLFFSYIEQTREFKFTENSNSGSDKSTENVMTAGAKYWSSYPLSEVWSIRSGMRANLMYFENKYDYNDPTTALFREQLDGFVVNTDAWAFTMQPSIESHYRKPQSWGHWEAYSKINYFYGHGWGEANNGDIGNPEGWYWINGLKGFYDIADWGGYEQTLFSSVRRIDVGADLQVPLGAAHFYEWGLGWLVSAPFLKTYIDNIGIGVNLNYGSSLKGGTIVLLFNQN